MGSVTNGNIPDLPPGGGGGSNGNGSGDGAGNPRNQAKELQAHIAAASLTMHGMLEREAQLAADFRRLEEQNKAFVDEMRRKNVEEAKIKELELNRNEVVSLRSNNNGDVVYIGIGSEKSGLTHIMGRPHYDEMGKDLGISGRPLIERIMSQASMHPKGVLEAQNAIQGHPDGYVLKTILGEAGNGWLHDAFSGKKSNKFTDI